MLPLQELQEIAANCKDLSVFFKVEGSLVKESVGNCTGLIGQCRRYDFVDYQVLVKAMEGVVVNCTGK